MKRKGLTRRLFIYLSCFIIIFFLFTSAVLLSSCTTAPSETTSPARQSEKKLSLVEERGTPIDIFLLLDQSDSMNGWDSVPATDPNGLRIDASKYFINNLSQRSENEPYLRIGIIEFGTDAILSSSLTAVSNRADDSGVQRLNGVLKARSLEYTNFLAALQMAQQEFQNKGTLQEGRKPLIVIFTDGEPDDPRGLGPEEYFSEIEDFTRSKLFPMNCEVFVIGVDAIGEAWNRTLPFWQSFLQADHIFHIGSMEELNQKFNEVIWKIFYLPSTTPDIISEGELDFEVQPYLEKIQFDIYPEGEARPKLIIYQPDGEPVIEGPGVEKRSYDKYDTIIVMDPTPGTWHYEITGGQGKVVIYKTLLPIVMRLVSPKDPHPLGRPINLVATYQKKDGSEVKELPQYPLRFTGSLITPDNETIPFLLKKQDSRLFTWEATYTPSKVGNYKIILTVQGREGFEVKSENEIQVKEIPYLLAIYPTEDTILSKFSNHLQLEVMLAKKGEETSPIGLFTDNPNALIVAEVVQRPDNDLSREKTIYLDYDPSSNHFNASLATNLDKEGSYTVKLELEGKLTDGTPIKDQIPIIFQVRLSTMNKLMAAWWFWLSIGVFILLAISVFLLIQRNQPRLRGSLWWNGEKYSLDGKRKFTIGDQRCNIRLEDPNVKGKLAWLVPRWERDEEDRKVVEVEVHYAKDKSEFKIEKLENGSTFELITGDSFEYILEE